MQVTTHSITNPRDGVNKDRFLVDLERKIFVICDGVSSESRSDEAADAVIKYIQKENFPSRITKEFANFLLKRLNAIVSEFKSGSTFTLLKIENDEGILIHTGDSECYQIKNHKIKELTTPFTIAYGIYKAGLIKLEEVKRHDRSNALLECLGHNLTNPQLKRFKLNNTSGFVLCSDGANYCEPEDMIKFSEYENSAKLICQKAWENGSKDDITAIAVRL